ncbi:MAG: GNAT family N-acetyltransferase, partial [Pseudomonadota bacterium]
RERAAGCVLVGDPGYYGRFGFLSDGRVTYAGVDAAYVLRKLIAGPDTAGEAVFPPAFGAAG